MSSHQEIKIVFILLLLITSALGLLCPIGQVEVDGKCILCQQILKKLSYRQNLEMVGCCENWLVWSNSRYLCRPQIDFQYPTMSSLRQQSGKADFPTSNRLLTDSVCNTDGGFILYQQTNLNKSAPLMCTNCRILPYSESVFSAIALVLATLHQPSFPQVQHSITASAIRPTISTLPQINVFLVPQLPLLSLVMALCIQCSLPFVRRIFGCTFTTSLPNGGDSFTACTTGFDFFFYTGTCICNFFSGYILASNGVCTRCEMMSTVETA